MSKIKICADSVCDLSEDIKNRYGITTVPLYVNKGDETLKDGVQIGQKEVFEYYRKTGKLCSTSAVNVGDFMSFFSEQIKDCDELIMITIGSEFSSCFQNACLAAEEIGNVYVVDSRSLSTGEGLVAAAAARLASKGGSAGEITTTLRMGVIPKVNASFFISDVNYLHKGGRCSSVAALGANLLKLKPCIEVKDSKMSVVKKYRGNIQKTISDYVKDRLKNVSTDGELCFVTHTTSPENAAFAAEEVKKYASFEHIAITDAGCTVACHCGEDTLGVLFINT